MVPAAVADATIASRSLTQTKVSERAPEHDDSTPVATTEVVYADSDGN